MLRPEFRHARTATLIAFFAFMIWSVAANRDEVVQAQRLEPVLVCVYADGTQYDIRTAQTTVGSVLKENRTEVGPYDLVTPATDERPYNGMKITVVRVKEAVEETIQLIDYDTVRTSSSSLRLGGVKVLYPGAKGEKIVRYRVIYHDGRIYKRTVIDSEVLKKPIDRKLSIGSRGGFTSRGGFRTRKVLHVVATAYDPGPRSCGKNATGRTSCGMQAGYGVVAVDPRVIKLGSRLYVEGYGFAIAGDVGRAIKGRRVDLGFDSYSEAVRYGRRKVHVHVLQR